MNLPKQRSFGRPLITAAVAVLGGLCLWSCERDDNIAVDRNLPPETYITEGPDISPDPENPTTVFYRVHLYWRGEDRDGTVAGFRFAIDDTLDPGAWRFTTRTDSLFRFSAGEVGAKSHLFLIRSVDNLGKQDATPDTVRFEAFTLSAPIISFVAPQTKVVNSEGTSFGLASGDTVLVNSTVTFVWTGNDPDGDIVRWESFLGTEAPVVHARNDTTRTVGPLASGSYDFVVRAYDDAGAVSTAGGVFRVTSNFDPICRIDSTLIRSSLDITWLDSDPEVDSVLVLTHDLSQPAGQDTIPYGATVSFCWECTDRDGPLESYLWVTGNSQQRVTDLCADTDSICAFDADSGFVVCESEPFLQPGTFLDLYVKGRDVYGRSQGSTLATRMQLNYAPKVTIDPPTGPLHAGDPVQFTFHATDLDSDPFELQYRWWFDDEIPPGAFRHFPTGFPQSDPGLFGVGPHQMFVQAVDQSGLDRPSPVERLSFEVIP